MSDRVEQKGKIGRVAAAILFAAIGLVAGWVAGERLSGAVSHSAPNSIDLSVTDSNPALEPEVQHQSSIKEGSPDSQQQAKPPAPDVRPVPSPQKPPDAEAERPEIPNYEDATKEIGRQAFKKIMKDMKRINQDRRQDLDKNANENR